LIFFRLAWPRGMKVIDVASGGEHIDPGFLIENSKASWSLKRPSTSVATSLKPVEMPTVLSSPAVKRQGEISNCQAEVPALSSAKTLL